MLGQPIQLTGCRKFHTWNHVVCSHTSAVSHSKRAQSEPSPLLPWLQAPTL